MQRNSSNIEQQVFEATSRAMSHHARDGSGAWQAGNIALGHAMTWFTPQARSEILPYTHAPTGIVLTSDARIDNRPELASQLGIAEADIDHTPDSQFILQAYLKWGQDCPKHLIGDYVFMVWDPRSESLFGARDPIGIRWLYYADTPARFAFASDMAGMLELIDESPILDFEVLDDYFRVSNGPRLRRTLYRNIHKLQPGHAILATQSEVKTWAFWRPQDVRPLDITNPREGARQLGELIARAVADRCRAEGRTGVHLSGGLDSSVVSAYAARTLQETGQEKPLAFTWSPPFDWIAPLQPPELDERTYVNRIADKFGLEVLYTRVTPEVDAILETADPSILPNNSLRHEYRVMEVARERGVRVLLSGWGGDEFAFTRMPGYVAGAIRSGRWLELIRLLYANYGFKLWRWAKKLYIDGFYPLLPPAWQARVTDLSFLQRRKMDEHTRALQKIIDEKRTLLPAKGFFSSEFFTRLEKAHHPPLGWRHPSLHEHQVYMLTILLGRVESWAAWSARMGVRHTYPLLDQRVIEFVLSMPEAWSFLPPGTRTLAYWAVEDVLPKSLFDGRDKQDRALQQAQKPPEHKAEVKKRRTEALEHLRASNPPSAHWLDFDYLIAAQMGPDAEHNLPVQVTERRGIWEAIALAFIDRRARMGGADEN